MTWEQRAPGVWVEPVDMEFEAASAYLLGKRRKGESAVDLTLRVVRVRELLRAEAAVRRVEALRDYWYEHSAPVAANELRRALDGDQ